MLTLLENARVRVLDTLIPAGERTPIHTHRWPAVHHVISGIAFVRRDADGAVLVDTRASADLQNPPAVKPDTQMPNLGLNASEIDSLVAYLQTLK